MERRIARRIAQRRHDVGRSRQITVPDSEWNRRQSVLLGQPPRVVDEGEQVVAGIP
ncbi:hypothetical protein AB5J72_00800 [Streptomyces sp. CG1]|uniref:hypothetical protein n=1 Tax=Streptomyces sp. CG1 TaxID=1287523 RepID=UPI0034E22AEE